jgi:predicted nuclease of predicted toxin-antitoxin system
LKFKLDENFGSRTTRLFQERRLDVHTVADEQLSGSSDEAIFAVSAKEERCLITLDLDFCDVIRFPPESGAGVAVIRIPHNPTLVGLEQLVASFLDFIGNDATSGKLWIVEPGRIRVRSKTE